MIPIIVGIIFIILLFGLIYYLREPSKKDDIEYSITPVNIVEDPKREDIVLAKISNDPVDYAIMWNGNPSKTYNYKVESSTGIVIAKGDVRAPSSGIVKIKGIPISDGEIYDVSVDTTKIQINFSPPEFINSLINEKELDCDTNIVPTGIEVLSSGNKIPLSRCQIKLDPQAPGFSCQSQLQGEVVLMVYNGPNAVNIMSRNI